MKLFIIDQSEKYDYQNLLEYVNSANGYYKVFRTKSLFQYFANFIVALVNDRPLTLIDSDAKADEIEGLNESDINHLTEIGGQQFSSIENLIDTALSSTSEITIFTSGTTGQPKKVIHSVATLARAIRKADKYKDFIWAFAYNPTHMAGLQVFFQAFSNANTLINVFNAQRKQVYQLIEFHKITHVSATPTFYRLLLPVEQSYPLVQRITLGGEKSDKHLYDSIQKIFPNAKLNNIYASTEAGSLFAAKGEFFQLPKDLRDKFKVEEDELLIHKSLLGKSDSLVIVNDYYHSGDIIEWVDNAEGIFKFKSRKNELINVGGYKVNPGEVEDSILSMDGIQQAIVYGKSNSVLGNILCAEVRLEKEGVLTELDIRKYLSGKLQDFKVPRRIKFVSEFSLTRTGKIKRS